jgi:hypothetical protein
MREQRYKRKTAELTFDRLDERVVPAAVSLQQAGLGGFPIISLQRPGMQFANNQFTIRSLPAAQRIGFTPGARPLASVIGTSGIFSPNQLNIGFSRVLPGFGVATATSALATARNLALQSLANRLTGSAANLTLARAQLAQALFQASITHSGLLPFFGTNFTSASGNSGLLPFFLPNLSNLGTGTTTTNSFIPGATSSLTTFNGTTNPFSPVMNPTAAFATSLMNGGTMSTVVI